MNENLNNNDDQQLNRKIYFEEAFNKSSPVHILLIKTFIQKPKLLKFDIF